MIYTGIGSRDTPPDILTKMTSLGRYMASWGHTLRSGGAKGADTAFEKGCVDQNGKMEIYLPYTFFNKNDSLLIGTDKETRILSSLFHPDWNNVSSKGWEYLGRNAYQILGKDLKTPTDFVVCWTPNGKVTGGTGHALRIADHYRIPIFNFGSMTLSEMDKAITSILP